MEKKNILHYFNEREREHPMVPQPQPGGLPQPDHLLNVLCEICEVPFNYNTMPVTNMVRIYQQFDWDKKGHEMVYACATFWNCFSHLHCLRFNNKVKDEEEDLLRKVELAENNPEHRVFFKKFMDTLMISLRKHTDSEMVTFTNVFFALEQVLPGKLSESLFTKFRWPDFYEIWVSFFTVHKFFCFLKKNSKNSFNSSLTS